MQVLHQLPPGLEPQPIANTVDPRTLDLRGVDALALCFPKFTDGRAFTQAHLLRRRLGFRGAVVATGEVLVDQLQQMRRCGFTHAVLCTDQDVESAQRLLALYDAHYQGDALSPLPHFATEVQT